jgi:hypothetical protein
MRMMPKIARNCIAQLVAAAAGLGLAAVPAAAQSPARPDVPQQVKAMAAMYAVTDYALGANERCDLFLLGEYRAMRVLNSTLRAEIAGRFTPQQMDALGQAKQGRQEWTSCLTRVGAPQAWARINNALLLARALITAPSRMTRDPKTCPVADQGLALGKYDWPYAATVPMKTYATSPRKAEFDGLARDLAAMIDAECARNGKSVLMHAGFEALVHSEDIQLSLQKSRTNRTALTPVGRTIGTNVIGDEIGIWRSRLGGFVGTRGSAGLNVYRVVARGDENVLFLNLTRPALQPQGRIFVSRQGRWTARLKSNVDAMQLQLSDGTRIDLAKLSGQGEGAFGQSEFVSPPATIALLARKPDTTEVMLAYRVKGGDWTPFQDFGLQRPVHRLSLATLREALAWASAPMPLREDIR